MSWTHSLLYIWKLIFFYDPNLVKNDPQWWCKHKTSRKKHTMSVMYCVLHWWEIIPLLQGIYYALELPSDPEKLWLAQNSNGNLRVESNVCCSNLLILSRSVEKTSRHMVGKFFIHFPLYVVEGEHYKSWNDHVQATLIGICSYRKLERFQFST